tara:strand:+ start:863 stop:1750 length:888 start_codon:yes stop_codon:yes gene_type:complete
MLSILIPVYNYDISNLVREIHQQASESKIKFEIICCEDGSDKYIDENKSTIDSLTYAKSITSKKNLGRTQSRQLLSDASIYNWLLFFDSDVMPKNDTFIKNYIKSISIEYDALYGGFAYENSKPESNYILRWKYGKKFEEVGASKRNSHPYQIVISGNFLIKKDIFKNINAKIKRKSYGLDNYFGILLKQGSIRVKHLNNPVFHLGLDESHIYLAKTEEAIDTLLWLLEKNKVFAHENKLLSVFCFLKKYKLNSIVSYCFKNLSPIMKNNITSSKPNIFLFQFYKIGYMCYKDLK